MLSQLAAAESRHRRVGVDRRLKKSFTTLCSFKTCFNQAANIEENSWSLVTHNYNEEKVKAHLWKRCRNIEIGPAETFRLSSEQSKAVKTVMKRHCLRGLPLKIHLVA